MRLDEATRKSQVQLIAIGSFAKRAVVVKGKIGEGC